MSYLRNISRLSGVDNLGGLLTIQVARKDDVQSIPDPIGNIIAGDIVCKAGAGFVTWNVSIETPRSASESRLTREGSTKRNSLSFSVPKDRWDIAAMFVMAEDDEFIVVYTDSNGTRKLFGTIEEPVRFTSGHDSGGNFSSLNFFSGEFFYDGPDNRYFYSGAITAAPPSVGTSRVEYLTGELIALLSPSDQLIVSSDFEHTFTLVPGSGSGALPAVVKWDTGEVIASLQPGDTLRVDTDFTFDYEIIDTTA